jgi:hypothetical protein
LKKVGDPSERSEGEFRERPGMSIIRKKGAWRGERGGMPALLRTGAAEFGRHDRPTRKTVMKRQHGAKSASYMYCEPE